MSKLKDIAVIAFVAVGLPVAWLFSRSQSVDRRHPHRWMAYQVAAVGLLMVVGAVGVLTEVGTLRLVFGALAVAGIVRLAALPRQARVRSAAG